VAKLGDTLVSAACASEAAARLSKLTKTAAKLNITQTAVSHGLRGR
jgi:hypothetical protein